jgi:hypothetical protein
MSDDLDDQLLDNAKSPAKVSGDAGSVEQHSLSDQIEVDRYLNSKKAAKSKRRGLRINKLVPPGTE